MLKFTLLFFIAGGFLEIATRGVVLHGDVASVTSFCLGPTLALSFPFLFFPLTLNPKAFKLKLIW